ncbi:MAG: cytochrome bc complex cytochrome b subunit, partial [Candidatus Aminicenantes bacterium]|nr:cytochrome bc complex cytochrome b subunit [Candidatus Aminicenantes bacterium]
GWTAIRNFLREKKVPQTNHTLWLYTGSLILLFLMIQVITGIVLALYYKPTVAEANESVRRIMTEVPLGWIIRSLHFWSATGMIATVFIHMVSIWLLKAYRRPRELTWMTGVFLLIITLGFGFTGYLLPWDNLSLAATKVGTDIPRVIPLIGDWISKLLRGGEDVGADTLTRFYLFHICVLPLAIFLLIALHLFLIQKHGISFPLKYEIKGIKVEVIPFWPDFVLRESRVWLVALGALITIAIFLPRPLGPQADMLAPTPTGIKPEWYFLFLFQTLKLFPSQLLFLSGESVAILLILVVLGLFFFLPIIDNQPAGLKGRIITFISLAMIIYAVVMTIWSLVE